MIILESGLLFGATLYGQINENEFSYDYRLQALICIRMFFLRTAQKRPYVICPIHATAVPEFCVSQTSSTAKLSNRIKSY